MVKTVEELYKKYRRQVYNYIYGMVLQRETAEDLAAEVFIAALGDWRKISSLEEKALLSWLYTVARHKTLNHLQKASSCREESCNELPETAMPVEEAGSLLTPENQEAEYILSRLTLGERELLELRYSWGLSNGEIARLGNTSENNVSHRFRRLLIKCRKIHQEKKK